MSELKPKASARPQRKPIGIRNRLDIIQKEPDRIYRLIDTDPGRIEQFENAGYRIESKDEHTPKGLRVNEGQAVDNVFHVGGGQKQVLVSQDKETWEEDQRAKQREHDKILEGLKEIERSTGFYGKIDIQK